MTDRPVKIDVTTDGRQTRYTITGTREQVDKAIEAIERGFHPVGYGTRFTTPEQREPGGPFVATGSRYNSCD